MTTLCGIDMLEYSVMSKKPIMGKLPIKTGVMSFWRHRRDLPISIGATYPTYSRDVLTNNSILMRLFQALISRSRLIASDRVEYSSV